MAMTELTEKLSNLIHSKGIEAIKPHTKKHIRRQIEKEFKSSLKFLNAGGTLLCWPDSLTIDVLVKDNFKIVKRVPNVLHVPAGPKKSCSAIGSLFAQPN